MINISPGIIKFKRRLAFAAGCAIFPSGAGSPARKIAEKQGMVPKRSESGNGDKSFIRLFDILERISRSSGGLPGREIARETGVASSTVFRMLKFLTDRGFLLNIDRKYILGPSLVRMGDCARMQNPLPRIARPFLEELSERTMETVHLAVLRQDKVFYVDKVEGTRSVRMSSLTGSFAPVYCTGVGKALLAFQRAESREACLRRIL